MRYTSLLFALLLAGQYPLAANAAPAAPVNNVKSANFVRGAPLPKWALPLPEVPASERADPVVLRMADTQVSLTGEPSVLYSRALQVNDQGALADIGQYSIVYAPAYQKLLVHKVVVLRNGQQIDRTASVNMRSLEREQRLEQGMYGGEVSLQLLMQDVRVGDTLWITYTIEGQNPVFGKRWAQTFGWDSNGPTEYRRLVVTHPSRRPLHWRQAGDFRTTELKPRIEQLGGDERLMFVEKAYEGLDDEPSVPSEYLAGRVLQFSEFKDWAEVAQWAAGMFPAVRPSPALKALAHTFEKEATPAARAAAALHWVQDEVRYFSVSIGENSHRPQAPDTVLTNRYGDCKDKSYLLVTLLGMLGMEARPMLVSASAPLLPGRMLASPSWFDHVIVQLRLNGKDYYLDPTQTGQTEALDALPVALPGASGLLVDAKSLALQQIPLDARLLPDLEIEESVSLAEFDGAATLETKRYYRGQYAPWARRNYTGMALVNLKKHALEPYEKSYPGISLKETPRYGDQDGAFVVTSRFTIPAAATKKDKLYAVAFNTKVLDGALGIPDKVVRNYPFAPSSGRYTGRYRMHVQWPDKARLNNEPWAREIDTPYFRVREDYIHRGNTLDYQMDFNVKQSRVAAADVPELAAKAKKLNEFYEGTFRVSEDSFVPDEARALTLRQFSPMVLGADFERRYKAIEGKKESELTTDEMCAYLTSLYRLHDAMPAEKAKLYAQMDPVLKAYTRKPDAAYCFGFALLVRGQYKDSAAAYRLAKPADDDASQVLAAYAEHLAGDDAAALAAMERYAAKRQQDGTLNDVESANLAAILTRAAKPLPSSLLAHAAADPAGPWPRPVLALYAGSRTPEQVLSAAGREPGYAGSYALEEAWFHIGQLRLARGDKAGARDAFGWIMENGLRSSIYYLVAKGELQRLDLDGVDLSAAIEAYRRGDGKAGFSLLQQLAQGGQPAAQFELGTAYNIGNGVGTDLVAARSWFQRAAEGGHPMAQRQFAAFCRQGLGGPVDLPAALHWYERAATQHDMEALYGLGTMYGQGHGVQRNIRKSMDFMLRAANLGHPEAEANVAQAYADGSPWARNEVLAFYWADRAATAGVLRMETLRAVLLRDGEGLKKNPELAQKLLQVAAERGDADATVELAVGQAKGKEDDRNVAAQVAAAYRKAIDQGSARAMLMYGWLLMEGRGIEKDLPAARKLLQQAGERGVIGAYVALAELEREHDQAAAAAWLAKAAEFDHPLAQNNLADMYEKGRGVPQDLPRALALYQRAALGRLPVAFASLGELYSRGVGVERDLTLSYTYLALAARFQPGPRWEEERDKVGASLKAAERVAAAARAAQWEPGQPLPGFSEASASPAGRE